MPRRGGHHAERGGGPEGAGIGLHVLVRPRAGDFVYDRDELDLIRRDVELAGQWGAGSRSGRLTEKMTRTSWISILVGKTSEGACGAVKSVRITLDEEVARWVRESAAEHELSVSGYVGEMLKSRMQSELGYERAMQSFLGRKAKPLKASGAYPTRDELHDRSALR